MKYPECESELLFFIVFNFYLVRIFYFIFLGKKTHREIYNIQGK